MTLKETLLLDMKTAMRDRDVSRLETIRLLRAAIQRKEVDEKIQLEDGAVLQIAEKMIKQCADAAEQFSKGARRDLADKERTHIAILEAYLPELLSEHEIDSLIDEAIRQSGATSIKEMGKVIGRVKSMAQEHGGRVDMAAVSAIIKSRLA